MRIARMRRGRLQTDTRSWAPPRLKRSEPAFFLWVFAVVPERAFSCGTTDASPACMPAACDACAPSRLRFR